MNEREEMLISLIRDCVANVEMRLQTGIVTQGQHREAMDHVGQSFGFLCAASGMDAERIKAIGVMGFRAGKVLANGELDHHPQRTEAE